MRRTLAVTATIATVTAAGLLVKRERDQQHRLDDLAARVAALSEAAQALVPPLQAMPALLAERRCVLDARDVDRLVRAAMVAKADLKSQPGTSAIALGPPPDKPEPSPPSPQQVAALDRAKARLADAMARHTLTRDDVLEMRAELASVGTAEAEALRARIASAINHRELIPQDRHFFLP